MRFIAILTVLALPLLPLKAAADSKPEEVKPEEFKCDHGEQQSREVQAGMNFYQEMVRDAANPRVFRPGKLVIRDMSVLYCHDGKKGGVSKRQLDSPVPLAKAFILDVPAKAKKMAHKVWSDQLGDAFLGMRAKLLGGEPAPDAACGASDCRDYYHQGPPNEHHMEPAGMRLADLCQPLVMAYVQGLAQGEIGKLLPGKKVGKVIHEHKVCHEYFSGTPSSGKMAFVVEVGATMSLTD